MSNAAELKKAIRLTLYSPPSVPQMLKELGLRNIALRQKEGDIGLFTTINSHLIEQIWKLMKINELLDLGSVELEKVGLNRNRILAHRQVLLEKLNLSKTSQNPLEGFSGEGFLELEVFKKDTNKVN